MSEENDFHLIFAIVLILSISLAILAFFCGDDIMKNSGLVIVSFISICIFAVLLLIFFAVWLFSSPEKICTKKWSVYSASEKITENTEKLFFDETAKKFEKKKLNSESLKIVEFDIKEWKVPEDFFVNCQNIKEVTFFQRPENFNSGTFSKNLALKKVNLFGNCEQWKDFKIITPVNCEINFIPTKTIKIKGKKNKNNS